MTLLRVTSTGPRSAAAATRSAAALALTVSFAFAGCGPSETPEFIAPSAPQHRPDALLPAREDLVLRLILIGDAGDWSSEPVLDALQRWGDWAPERTTVLFLGDNLYPVGLGERDRKRGEAILRRQIEATTARKIFVPGNHDWGKPSRVSTIESEADFIDGFEAVAAFAPEYGCPGPFVRTLAAAGQLEKPVTAIFLDLQWWRLDPEDRPDCGGIETEAGMLDELARALETRRDEWVVVASHVPFRSGGPHGRRQSEHEASARQTSAGAEQPPAQPPDVEAVMRVGSSLAKAPPLLAVAGHDHSLQVLDGQPRAKYVIVSGAGSQRKITPVEAIEGMYFAHAHPGFIVVDFRRAPGGDLVTLVVVEPESETPVFAMDLVTPQSEPEG